MRRRGKTCENTVHETLRSTRHPSGQTARHRCRSPREQSARVRLGGQGADKAGGDRDAQSRVRRRPPTLGAHSREVIEHFGSGADQIERLFGAGAVIPS